MEVTHRWVRDSFGSVNSLIINCAQEVKTEVQFSWGKKKTWCFCFQVDLQFLDEVISDGADPNCSDRYGQTVLHEVTWLNFPPVWFHRGGNFIHVYPIQNSRSTDNVTSTWRGSYFLFSGYVKSLKTDVSVCSGIQGLECWCDEVLFGSGLRPFPSRPVWGYSTACSLCSRLWGHGPVPAG